MLQNYKLKSINTVVETTVHKHQSEPSVSLEYIYFYFLANINVSTFSR